MKKLFDTVKAWAMAIVFYALIAYTWVAMKFKRTKRRRPISPLELLQEEWINPLGLREYELVCKSGLSAETVSSVMNGAPITQEIANGLSRALGTTPQFWMNIQKAYDGRKIQQHYKAKIADAVRAYNKKENDTK